MPKEIKADNVPLNAGVTIDYSKPEGERVTFSYPNKENSRYKWAVKFIYPVMLKIWFFSLAGIIAIGGIIFSLVKIGIDSAAAGSLIVDWASIWESIKLIGILLGVMMIPPIPISLYFAKNYEKFNTIFPKLNFWTSNIFGGTTRCVVTKLDGLIYEIPHLSNIYMDYKATGEFGEYLERVDVIEHPFKFISKKKGKEIEKSNDQLWKSVFKFSQIPTTGKLEVNFI